MSFWATNGIRISCTLWGRVLSGPVNSGPLTRSSFVPMGIAQPCAAVFSTGIGPSHPIEGTIRLGNSVVEKLKKMKEPNLGLGVPLTTSHLNKKRQEKLRENNGFMEIAAYGVARLVDLDSLRKEFKKDVAYRSVPLPADLNLEVLLISANPNSQSDVVPRDAFIFRNGSIVFWNMPESQHRLFLNRVRRFCTEILPSQLVEREDLQFKFTEGPTRLVDEDIHLQTHESRTPCTPRTASTETLSASSSNPVTASPESNCDRLSTEPNTQPSDHAWPHLVPVEDPVRMEQFAFSDALALSVKLSLLENRFDAVAVQMEPWIEDMKQGRQTSFNRSSVLKKTGELFTLRHLLNVSTSMIETPDFYWDRPDIERLHDQLRSVLSISSRTRVLNSRLNMCCELTQILSNHLQSRHSAHLEWMIIILILVEVCFEASHYLHNRRRELEAHNVLAESHPSEQLHA
ncbi:Required for meiotic nuclear division protein 1 [Fasciola hepatica]|uniref:Required for meiotic nuclear division protein 1 n=1 Tax=Fasciola hepatica TaxID=6192 RepID=A0A4E0RXU5_FASHE|nr:Required for meiotic nuclear division protein 1 [Fasciola hepatica]